MTKEDREESAKSAKEAAWKAKVLTSHKQFAASTVITQEQLEAGSLKVGQGDVI